MAYKIIDMHTHSDNSPDGRHSAMYMCEQALMSGLRAIAITDHIEVDTYREKHFDTAAFQSFFETKKAKYAFRGELLVCTGIELGQPMHDVKTAEEIVDKLPYDFVIASVHNLKGMDDFCFLDYSELNIDELLTKYFDEVIEMCEWGRFDSLAHLTYPLRYITGENKIEVDITRYYPQIEAVLKLLIEKNIALEINTSGLRQSLNDIMPNENILNLYKNLGGDMITFGSDAHIAEDIGKGIDKGMEIADRCGFKHLALFQNRTPIQIDKEEMRI